METRLQTIAAESLESSSTDERVDRLVVQIAEHIDRSAMQVALEVGRLVIETFYGGNGRAWRRRGIKDASFRKLARHPKLPMSATSLYRAVACYEIVQRLGPGFPLERLNYSHLRAVLKLAPEQQQHLLTIAAEDAWSAKRLSTEATRQQERGPGGRPPKPRLVRAVSQLDSLTKELLGLKDTSAAGPGAAARDQDHLLACLRESRERIDACIEALE